MYSTTLLVPALLAEDVILVLKSSQGGGVGSKEDRKYCEIGFCRTLFGLCRQETVQGNARPVKQGGSAEKTGRRMAGDGIPRPDLGLTMAQPDEVPLSARHNDSVASSSPFKTWQTDTHLALGQTVLENIIHPLQERGTPAEEQPRLIDFVKQSEEAEYASKTKEEDADQKASERRLQSAEKDTLSTCQGGPRMLSAGSLSHGLQVLGSSMAHKEKCTSLQLFQEQTLPTMLNHKQPDLDHSATSKEEFADQKRQKTIGGKLQTLVQTTGKHMLTANQGAQRTLSLGNKIQALKSPRTTMTPTPGKISVSWQMLQDKYGEQNQQQVQKSLEFKAEFWSLNVGGALRFGPSSSSKSLLSPPEADQQEIDFLPGPQGQSVTGSSLDLLLSSLPSELSEQIMSFVPIETLIEWCSVCKDWKALILSGGLRISGHNIKPSTRNGPIALINCKYPIVDMVTYNRKLNIWQDQNSRHLIRPDLPPYFSFHTSGGLLCRYNQHTSHSMTIDICNPITKEYRRLRVPLVHAGQRGKDRMNIFWGVIVENEPDRYKVVVQNVTSLPNDGGPESVINQILIYNSVSSSWEVGGTLSPEIIGRVGIIIQCFTSSKGNLYFLTTDRNRAFERKRPRLIKYDAQRSRCTEINTPWPMFVGGGEPRIVEHRGGIIFVSRNRIQRNERRKSLWVFFQLEEANLNTWVKIKEMPEDVFDRLSQRIANVKCHGNGDLIYFYGATQGRPKGTVSVLAHDLVKNSWAWLADYQTEKAFIGLLSIQPSFIKV